MNLFKLKLTYDHGYGYKKLFNAFFNYYNKTFNNIADDLHNRLVDEWVRKGRIKIIDLLHELHSM